ncbi:O-antigen ligase [Propionispora sp. 2/2-37]|uniref:O-antigen ligase family protein n=1 Tax=Propionispora sp. 2/2-37 TaxID=1677858 RepID=UPI001F225213|nr:O-antigen ligase family protein [Propionispora sp. 2/2-37]
MIDLIIEHCIMAVAFFLPLSLNVTSVLLAAGGFFWLLKMIMAKSIFSQRTLFDGLIVFYVIWSGLSITNSPDTDFSSYNYYQLFGRYVLIYYLIVNNIQSQEQLKRLVKSMMISAILVVMYGFYQYTQGMDISTLEWVDDHQFPEIKIRVFSTLHNPNLLAGFLVIMSAIIAGLSCGVQKIRHRVLLYGLLLMLAACLLFTYSRGAWVSILAVIVIFSLLYSRKFFWLLLLIPLLLLYGQHNAWERVLSIFNPTDTSASMRMALWESTMAMIMDKPWFGVGWGAYWLAYPQYDFYIHNAETTIFHAHNMYLGLAAEIGIPGLLSFLAILCGHMLLTFKLLRQGSKWMAGLMLGILAALASLAVGGITDYILFNIQMSMLFWLLLAIVTVAWQLEKRQWKRR